MVLVLVVAAAAALAWSVDAVTGGNSGCCISSLISGKIKGGGESAGLGATLGGVVGVSLTGDVGDTNKSS